MPRWEDKIKAEWIPGIDSFVMFGFWLHIIHMTEEKKRLGGVKDGQ